jgi:hypothetical protein
LRSPLALLHAVLICFCRRTPRFVRHRAESHSGTVRLRHPALLPFAGSAPVLAACLLAPYLVWVAYSAVFNAALWRLNA